MIVSGGPRAGKKIEKSVFTLRRRGAKHTANWIQNKSGRQSENNHFGSFVHFTFYLTGRPPRMPQESKLILSRKKRDSFEAKKKGIVTMQKQLAR
jgi:hypothetical protein